MADDSVVADSKYDSAILVNGEENSVVTVDVKDEVYGTADEVLVKHDDKVYPQRNSQHSNDKMSVNLAPSSVSWGDDRGVVTGNNGIENKYNRYVALDKGIIDTAYVVNYLSNGGEAKYNVLEMFSGDIKDEVAGVKGANNADSNLVVLHDVGTVHAAVGAVSNEENSNATKNVVFVTGGEDIQNLGGAVSITQGEGTGSLTGNLVVLGAGKVRSASGAVALSDDGNSSKKKSKEVIGNRVLLGVDSADTKNGKISHFGNTMDSKELRKRMGKNMSDPVVPAQVAQIMGGFSETNKANNNIVIIGEGLIGGKGMFTLKHAQANPYVNGIDVSGLNSPDQVMNEPQEHDYFIIGGVSDVEATGNIVDINNAKALASGKVGIWGGHYFSSNATGDIKTGNTLNLNRVKGITLSYLANFENYNFDLPKDVVNGDTILTVTDLNGTDVSNTKINVGVSGEAPVLHKGDAIKLIYNTNGVTTTGAQYGKLQQGASLSYDITAKAGDDNKSVVAVVKDPSTENTVTPTPPSTGDTTNPVALSTGDTAGTTPSIGGTTGTTPAETNTNLRKPYSILVDAEENSMVTVDSNDVVSADPDVALHKRDDKKFYTKPTGNQIDDIMSVNSNSNTGWGPKVGIVTDDKNTQDNYLGLVNGTTKEAYTVSYSEARPNNATAKLNAIEMFSGDITGGISAVSGAKNAEKNIVILRNVGTIENVAGAVLGQGDGSAINNRVFLAGGQDIQLVSGAAAFDSTSSTGSLKENLVVAASGTSRTAFGAFANVSDEGSTLDSGTTSNINTKEVIGNRVLIGIDSADTENGKINGDSGRVDSHELKKEMGKSESDSIVSPKVGQVIGGFSKTNKANKNVVVIGEGSIAGKGLFKVKQEQSKHHVNGIDTNGVIPEAMEDSKQEGNNFIIGGVSDVEATGNIVDINNAKALASGKVAIWGGHYFSDNATGDIKTGNTLNLNKVKGITLSQLSNFEIYNFDLPKDVVNGDTILTVTDPNGTDVSNTKINVGVSGEAPALHKDDTIKLIYNTNGVTTTGTQYGKLQQGASFSYDISAKAGDDNKSVVAVVNNAPVEGIAATVLPQTKSFVETRAAVSSVINDGQGSMEKAFANTSSTSPIVAGMGHGNMRVESGSYVNIKGTNVVLGLGKQSGKTYWGPFVEMGWSRYDSHLDSGLRADGNAKYYGIGVYGKTTYDNGIYLEGSIRGGRTSYNYESNEIKTATKTVHTSYDAHNMYYGAHVGLGKVVSYGNGYEGTVYANVFYSHQGEATATLKGEGLGETYTFAGVNSLRTRLGYKVSKQLGNSYTGYAGAAYEREFSGEAHATVKDASTLAPSLGGSSGLVEVGVTYGSTADTFTGTLNVEGWFGQKRGTTFGGRVNWKY